MTDNPHGLVLPPELNPRGAPRTSSRRRVARVLSWIAVVTSVCVFAASGVGYGLYRYYDGNIDRIPIRIGGKRPAKVPGKAINFLLIGSDSREGASKDELKRFATEFTPGRRSDTMVLIHLAANRDRVTLLSFPRDSYVEIPAYGKRASHRAKINTAFASGGQDLAIQTVEQLTGIRIDHYLEVNFAGFQRMVDALGGVDVCLPRPARDRLSGINLPAGRSHVKGTQALAFVRQREGVPGGDLGRIQRQQQFMGAMMRQATSLGVLLNPVKLLKFLKVATDSLRIDEELSFDDMKSLAMAMRGLDPQRVQFVTVPVDRLARRGSQSVVLIDEERAALVYDAIAHDRPLPGTEPAAPAPAAGQLTVAPRNIRVQVRNGAGVTKLAARVADDLRGVGFRVTGTGNADRSTYPSTVVRHGTGRADSARTVAAAIPGATLVADPRLGATIDVVVGRDYRGVRAVTVTAPTGGTPAARPSATPGAPKVTTAADDPCA